MVKYQSLDSVFASLADPTRRKILESLSHGSKRVTDIAKPYRISLPAVSKHLTVLEKAALVKRYKEGREVYVKLNPRALKSAFDYLEFYRQFWTNAFERLEKFLKKNGGEQK